MCVCVCFLGTETSRGGGFPVTARWPTPCPRAPLRPTCAGSSTETPGSASRDNELTLIHSQCYDRLSGFLEQRYIPAAVIIGEGGDHCHH